MRGRAHVPLPNAERRVTRGAERIGAQRDAAGSKVAARRSRLTEQLVSSKCCVASSHVRDRTGSRMGQDCQRFSRDMGLLASGQILLAGGMIPETQDGGFRERPCEIGVATLGVRGAVPYARRCCGTFDQTTGGNKLLHAWETTVIVDFIQEHQTQDRPAPGYRLPRGEGRGSVRLGCPDHGALHVVEPLVAVPHPGQVHFAVVLDRRLSTPLRESVPVGFGGAVLAEGREVILVSGLLHVGQSCGPVAHQMHPPPEQVPRRPHRGGIDRRLGPHAPAEEHGDFLGVALVIVGLAAVDRFHSARVTEDHREAFWRPQVGAPVPRQAALHGDHLAPPTSRLGEIVPLGDSQMERLRKNILLGVIEAIALRGTI
jgi:hypothetical protein